eukprot:scaffold2114_cov253-Pinguiococcus_pyrenoidosus.AAC.6
MVKGFPKWPNRGKLSMRGVSPVGAGSTGPSRREGSACEVCQREAASCSSASSPLRDRLHTVPARYATFLASTRPRRRPEASSESFLKP